ncbi:MAG: hypothetical protein CSA97_04850 [Bacteroidetes bacterium]|nr:MAG: hypothetical protein CSA97_04850 [Bacteroidota bacterium]
MNRTQRILLSIALAAILGFTACGESNDNAKIEGWWRHAEFSSDDGYYAYHFDGGKIYVLSSEASTQEAAIEEINKAIAAGQEGASIEYTLKGDILTMNQYDGVISWEDQLHVTFKGDTVVLDETEEDFKHNFNVMKERYEEALKEAPNAAAKEGIQKKYDEQLGSYDKKYKEWEADKDEPEVCVRFQPQE